MPRITEQIKVQYKHTKQNHHAAAAEHKVSTLLISEHATVHDPKLVPPHPLTTPPPTTHPDSIIPYSSRPSKRAFSKRPKPLSTFRTHPTNTVKVFRVL